ncbi:MAG: hypothetical protein QOI41_2336 [Myxococcales bacterium]|nr:hypothetical protein [Myxococcales bacterium]
MLPLFKRLFAPWLLAAFVCSVVVIACANNSVDMGQVKPDVDGSAQQFTPPPGTDAGDAAVAIRELSCIATECPPPWTTCLAESGPSYKCGTDLSRDPDNCGTCGNKCLTYKPIHMASRCIAGGCELECFSPTSSFDHVDWRNCNARVDDGCEIDVVSDPNNCGACGNACAAGTPCLDGHCGCPAGKILCDGFCVDPQKDDRNCGGCGVVCTTPAGACTPTNARFACFKGVCGHLQCQDGAADCNGDLFTPACKGDGCEVQNISTDRNNCGACGVTCTGAEECIDEGNGPTCAVPCLKQGKTLCGTECFDLLNDPGSCGSCGGGCQAPGPHQAATCKKGLCGSECDVGFADCNGNPLDGCETNLRTHPGNCGACGNACDIAGGQPCVEGACLMTTCEGGVR